MVTQVESGSKMKGQSRKCAPSVLCGGGAGGRCDYKIRSGEPHSEKKH